MEKEICNKLIDDMFDEIEGVEEYKHLAHEFEEEQDMQKHAEFKEMAKQELSHFEKIHKMLIESMSEEEKMNKGCFEKLHNRYVEKYKELKEEL